MEDKKNIVIKVKYPTPGNKEDHEISAPKVITEWNIKRILLALAGVIFLVTGIFYFSKSDTQQKDLQPVVESHPKAALPDNSVNTTDKVKNEINKNITRALLTFKINNNEPEGEIILPLKLGKSKPTSVYYFVELTGMKDRTVYHEWLLDDKLITRKKVNISEDVWRTSSRQLFAYASRTNWKARLVDEKGQVLNEIPFKVVYE